MSKSQAQSILVYSFFVSSLNSNKPRLFIIKMKLPKAVRQRVSLLKLHPESVLAAAARK